MTFLSCLECLLIVCSVYVQGNCRYLSRGITSRTQDSTDTCAGEGRVKLVGGSHEFEGDVLICQNGEWRYFCIFVLGIHWTEHHGRVVCRSLGFSTEAVEALSRSHDANNTAQHTVYTCDGSEKNMTECDSEEEAFICKLTGALRCEVPEDHQVCKEGDVQLVNGCNVSTASGQGRVEVCSANGIWGTVCHEGWDDADAEVVCRLLGFNGTGHEAVQNASMFGPGSRASDILLTGVSCIGNEDHLSSCPHSTDTALINTCMHEEDVGVICSTDETLQDEGRCTTCKKRCTTCKMRTTFSVIFPLLILILIIIVTLFIVRGLIIRRKRKRFMRRPSTAHSNYITTHSSNSPLNDESPNKWKRELDAFIIDRSLLAMEETLGEGCFGTVYKGIYHSESGDTIVAIKDIKSGSNADDFISECVRMKDFDHPNILGLVGVSFHDSPQLPLIVLPFMANGDLKTFLHSKRDFEHEPNVTHFPKGIDLSVVVGMCCDISHGMEYLAAMKFVHRDLAARNCMVSDTLSVKVADFGLSRDIYSKDYYRMGSKTPLPVKWMAPESLKENIFTEKSDVWSFGVVCWEVFTLGSTPYPGVSNHEISDYLASGHRLKLPQLCPEEIFKNVKLCWEVCPDERPDFAHIAHLFDLLVQNLTSQPMHPDYVNITHDRSPPK